MVTSAGSPPILWKTTWRLCRGFVTRQGVPVKYEKYVHHLTLAGSSSWTHRWDRNRWSWKRSSSNFLLTTRSNMRRFMHRTSLTNTNLFLCSLNYNMLSNWYNRVLMYSVIFRGLILKNGNEYKSWRTKMFFVLDKYAWFNKYISIDIFA